MTHDDVYRLNGKAMRRGAALALILAAFALASGEAGAACDPADPDCVVTGQAKKEQPKKSSSGAAATTKKDTAGAAKKDTVAAAKKDTAGTAKKSTDGAAQGDAKKQTGDAPKAGKKTAGDAPKPKRTAETPVEQITEENRAPGEKKKTGSPVRVNPVEFDKATGQHCSGQDEFRVCW